MKKMNYQELLKSYKELKKEHESLRLDLTTLLNETSKFVEMKTQKQALKRNVVTTGLKLLRQLAKSPDLKLQDILLQKLNVDRENQEFDQNVCFSKAQEELGIIFSYLLELEDCNRHKVILLNQSCAANECALDKVLDFLKYEGLLFDQNKEE
jgi:hypothetical protein